MDYKVKKGLDTPLKIQGMYLKYFYLWAGISIFLIFIIIFQVMGATSPSSNTSIQELIITIIISGAIFIGLKVYFVNVSAKKKIPNKNMRVIQSNVDLMKFLK